MPEAYQFIGVKFGPMIADRIPSVTRELVYSERHVPQSDKTILDIGGYGPKRLAFPIRVARANAAALEATLGRTGDLYAANILYPNATLLKCGGHSMNPRQVFADATWDLIGEWHFYDAEWIMGNIIS